MSKETIKALIEGGKASAAPPLGPALGPLGVNIGQVIVDINKKTGDFKGMQVPVSVIVDISTKEYSIEVGTPPASALIKKEAGIEKGSGKPHIDKVADLRIEQIIKIAKMKEDVLPGKTLKERVKAIIGTCNSMGILIEGKSARDAMTEVANNVYESEIKSEKTELSSEELKQLDEERKKLAVETLKRHEEEEKKARDIVASMAGKEKSSIKAKLHEAKISEDLIVKLLAEIAAPAAVAKPATTGASAAKPAAAKPAAGKK